MNPFVHRNQLIEHLDPGALLLMRDSDVMIVTNKSYPGCTHTRIDRITAHTFTVRHGGYLQLKRAEPQLP